MGYCKDPFHMNRQAQKGMKSIGTIFKIGAGIAKAVSQEAKAQQRARARQAAAYNRMLEQQSRERLRIIKQNEQAKKRAQAELLRQLKQADAERTRQQKEREKEAKRKEQERKRNEQERVRLERQKELEQRRAERERIREEKEREKRELLEAKKEEEERLNTEIKSIEEENHVWTSVHTYCDPVITEKDIKDAISTSEAEQNKALQQCDYKEKDALNKIESEYSEKLRDLELQLEKLPHECETRMQNEISRLSFRIPRPIVKHGKSEAEKEAATLFRINEINSELSDIKAKYYSLNFDKEEPSREKIEEELTTLAAEEVKPFFPWNKKKLIRKYVESKLDTIYDQRHGRWEGEKKIFLNSCQYFKDLLTQKEEQLEKAQKEKADFIASRTQEIDLQQEKAVKDWESQRKQFYADSKKKIKETYADYHQHQEQKIRNEIQQLKETYKSERERIVRLYDSNRDRIKKEQESYRGNLIASLTGEKEFVENAITNSINGDELPMEFFVDFVYDKDKGEVLVDLDLPEIEDVPVKNVVLTSTGKKSVRLKSQTLLREHYANCICGLSIYVADMIFNVSTNIHNVIISGFTQRRNDTTQQIEDQYVLLVNFSREQFCEIKFKKENPIDIVHRFKHHIDMTKSFILKQIDLGESYGKIYHDQLDI